MAIESAHSAKLIRAIGNLLGFFTWKINDTYAGGVPDIFIEGPKRDLWIEAKRIHPVPKKPDTIIDLGNEKKYLTKLQQRWLTRRFTTRGDAMVLVYTDDLGWALLTVPEAMHPIRWGDLKAKMQPPVEIFKTIENITSEGASHGKTLH